ncbi:MAG: DUF362 domain-containing protein [Candidatus Lokiarchaeota archaeon]|nr:DUF362 domain-containing protein [Candidatus Lokiarchaeota archaeon]
MDTTQLDFGGKVVMLKPSFVLPSGDEGMTLATNTHNAVIVGVARALLGKGARRVLVAEHLTVLNARFSFAMVHVKEAVEGIDGVELCYLDEVPMVKAPIEEPFIPGYDIKFPRMLLDGTVDYLVTLPKMKTNSFSSVSLSIKNSFGLISKRDRLKYHGADLDKHLASLHLVRSPDLVIVDAVVAGEGQGPQQTTPVATGLLVAGTNCVAVDAVCCHLMGHDPATVPHVKLLHDRGLGPISLDDIPLQGKDLLESRRRAFTRPDLTLALSPRIRVFQGKDTCRGGCLAMLRSILDGYGMVNGWDSLGDMAIIIGKGVDVPERGLDGLKKRKTIVFGDCAKEYKDRGVFIGGCPPEYLRTATALALRARLGVTQAERTASVGAVLWTSLRHAFHEIFKV